MPFSGPFRYYSIFVLLFVTIRRFGGPYCFDLVQCIVVMQIDHWSVHYLLLTFYVQDCVHSLYLKPNLIDLESSYLICFCFLLHLTYPLCFLYLNVLPCCFRITAMRYFHIKIQNLNHPYTDRRCHIVAYTQNIVTNIRHWHWGKPEATWSSVTPCSVALGTRVVCWDRCVQDLRELPTFYRKPKTMLTLSHSAVVQPV